MTLTAPKIFNILRDECRKSRYAHVCPTNGQSQAAADRHCHASSIFSVLKQLLQSPDTRASMNSLGWEGIYTLIVVVLGLAILFKDLAGPDFVFVGMLGLLLVTQIISLEEGLDGFSSSAPMTVAGEFLSSFRCVVVECIEKALVNVYAKRIASPQAADSSVQGLACNHGFVCLDLTFEVLWVCAWTSFHLPRALCRIGGLWMA